MNKLLGIGLIGAGAFGLIQLLRMKNVGDSISTKLVNPRVHKVSLTGIFFRTEVSINNPTRDSITITKPVVTLTTNKKNPPEHQEIFRFRNCSSRPLPTLVAFT